MAIRKFVALQLHNAAKVIEKDQSKEKLHKHVMALRIGLAQAIMPTMPLAKR